MKSKNIAGVLSVFIRVHPWLQSFAKERAAA
jgi:hypothetical protein